MDEHPIRSRDGVASSGDESAAWDPERMPIEELAAEFIDRQRMGERPTIDDYCQRFPELADEIRELFPVVVTMERMQHHLQRDAEIRSPAPLSIEQLGDYRVVGEIARGGMGIVCEAEQVTLGRRVAVKILPEHALRSEKDLRRFSREAQTAAKLHHTNIVPIFGVGEQDGVHYIVMQLIRGIGLDEILPEIRRLAGGGEAGCETNSSWDGSRSSVARRNAEVLLSEELVSEAARAPGFSSASSSHGEHAHEAVRAVKRSRPRIAGRAGEPEDGLRLAVGNEYWRNVVRIGIQAARALDYAHSQGTLHRDIKPGNLLLDEDGIIWVADFGLAKAIEQDAVTWTGDIVGTLRYMAPERFRGEADSRSDIYSLGLTLYELLTFQRAFDGTDRVALTHNVTQEDLIPPRHHNPAIPHDLETIVLKAAARHASDRYHTAEALAADLECFLEDRPIQARRAGPAELLFRWCRRNRAVASLAAAVVGVLLLASLSIGVGYMRELRQRRLAEALRVRAEATSQLAVGALDRIYGQFAPSPIRPVGEAADEEGEPLAAVQTQLPLSKDVALLLESLLDFYDKLSVQAEGDESVILKSVMAKRRVGDIQHRLGDLRKAGSAYESAIQQVAEIDADFREKEVIRLELARIQNGLGSVLNARREHKAAVAAHQRAWDMLIDESSAADTRYELARTSYLLYLAKRSEPRRGKRRRESREERRQHIQLAAEILTDLTERYPDRPEYHFLLARCYRVANRGPDEGRREKAIEILENLVVEFPGVADYQYELGDAYAANDFDRLWAWKQDEVDRSPEGLRAAVERLQKAFDTTRDLDISHPNIPTYLRLRARLFHTYATVLWDRGEVDEAFEQIQRGLEKQRLAVRHSLEDHLQEVLLAHMRLDAAKLLIELEAAGEARLALEVLVEELNELLDDPASRFSRFSRRFARDVLSESERLAEGLAG